MDHLAIGLVTTGFDKGGLEQVVFNLYEGYKAAGIPTYILCEKGSLMGYFASQLHDVRDFCIFEDSYETFIAFCYKNKITHLHYHYNTHFITQARECGIQTIYTIHNVYTWFQDDVIKEYKRTIDKCDNIVAVSSFVKNYFCTRTGLRESRVEVIPNGIKVEELMNSEQLPQKFTREQLGIQKDEIVFAQIASFTAVKHQIGLIGVMEKVIKKKGNIRLLLVGNVLEQDYYKEFCQCLKKSSAKDHITVVEWFDHRFMGEFLRETVDVAVLATLQEGCSNSVLEAIACEKPMILTNTGNASDVKSESVIVVSPAYEDICNEMMADLVRISSKKDCSNTSELANTFIKVSDRLAYYTEKAREESLKRQDFTTEKMVSRYLKLISEMNISVPKRATLPESYTKEAHR